MIYTSRWNTCGYGRLAVHTGLAASGTKVTCRHRLFSSDLAVQHLEAESRAKPEVSQARWS